MLPTPSLLPLFAYGSLLDEVFVGRLLEHPVSSEPAVLHGFERDELPGFGHPIVVEAEDASVEGRIYRLLSAEDFRRLDHYEGVPEGLYRRAPVRVVAGGRGEAGWG